MNFVCGGKPQTEKNKPMKSENKVKKLVLRKETLRDLTAQNAGQVKGGVTIPPGACSAWGCYTRGCTALLCSVGCATGGCHGKTYNKKCVG